MLARRSLARLAAQQPTLGAAPAGARNMATLRELELRLKSVRNIEKITKVCFRRFVFDDFGSIQCILALVMHFYASLVNEDDCVNEAGQGPACHAERQGVRFCQQRCVLYLSIL